MYNQLAAFSSGLKQQVTRKKKKFNKKVKKPLYIFKKKLPVQYIVIRGIDARSKYVIQYRYVKTRQIPSSKT